MNLRSLLSGLATYLPGYSRLHARRTSGAVSAKYCYSIWLRHLIMAYSNGLANYPKSIAEIGPGDSLGVGLASLLSGVEMYYSFDVVRHANNARNVEVFDELVEMYRRRERIPDDTEFPEVEPKLNTYEFPSYILSDDWLEKTLASSRVNAIKRSLVGSEEGSNYISYVAPWHEDHLLDESSVDMIISQAVLEHVDDLDLTYHAMNRWLKLGGFMTHVVDFKCHGMTHKWNGHWEYSSHTWQIVRGRRPYLINRQPHSAHLAIMKKNGFEVICDMTRENLSGITRDRLALPFKMLTDQDLITQTVFFVAVKLL